MFQGSKICSSCNVPQLFFVNAIIIWFGGKITHHVPHFILIIEPDLQVVVTSFLPS